MLFKSIVRNIFLFTFLFVINTHGQDKVDSNIPFSYHNENPAYIHVVEKGQTLYSISKKYNITVNEIEIFNDGLKQGLQLDNTIYIPIKTPSINHTVEKAQTLFSIAKIYQTSKSKIITDNKLNDENLKFGQVLKINFEKINQIKSVEHNNTTTEKNEEKLTTVSPTSTPNIEGKTTIEIDPNKIVVALLIPLYLDKNFTEEEISKDETEEIKTPPVFNKSYSALEFYEGLKLACDSFLSQKKVEIITLDCPSDTIGVQNILLNVELKKANIIIGPFNSNYAPFVAEYCKKNKKIYCTPFGQQGKILLNNEFAFKAASSNTTQLEQIAKYVGENFKNSQCFVVHNGLKKEKNLVDAFKLKYNSISTDSAKTIVFKDLKIAGTKNKLSTTKENVIIVCSNDQAFVTDFINKIYTLKDDYKITVFGTEQWSDYENLELNIIQELNLHIPSNYFINYNDSSTKKFIQKFRNEFYAEPTRAGFLGFDLMHLIIENSQNELSIKNLCENKFDGLHIDFDFIKTSHESGYENNYTKIFKYEDFILKAVDK